MTESDLLEEIADLPVWEWDAEGHPDGGGVVDIPTGKIGLTQTLEIPDYVHIRGDGFMNSILYKKDPWPGGPAVLCRGRLSNVGIFCDDQPGDGLRIEGLKQKIISHVYIWNVGGNGVVCAGGHRSILEHVEVNNATGHGFLMDNSDPASGNHNLVLGMTVARACEDGFHFEQSDGASGRVIAINSRRHGFYINTANHKLETFSEVITQDPEDADVFFGDDGKGCDIWAFHALKILGDDPSKYNVVLLNTGGRTVAHNNLATNSLRLQNWLNGVEVPGALVLDHPSAHTYELLTRGVGLGATDTQIVRIGPEESVHEPYFRLDVRGGLQIAVLSALPATADPGTLVVYNDSLYIRTAALTWKLLG